MTTTTATSSQIVGALESAWADIRAHHPEVPEAVVILGSGSSGKFSILGHHWPDRWETRAGEKRPEILVTGEGLARSACEVVGTLLHEAAHAVAKARGIKDTSRAGLYHNRRFVAIAQELGLAVSMHGATHGMAKTDVPEETAERYTEAIDRLAETMHIKRIPEPKGGRGEKKESAEKNGVVVWCPPELAGCGRQFRISRTALEGGAIQCVPCRQDFEEKETSGD